jgi:hypothetical protein
VCSADAKIDKIYREGGKYSTAGRWEGWKSEEDDNNSYLKTGFIFPNLKWFNEKSETKTGKQGGTELGRVQTQLICVRLG